MNAASLIFDKAMQESGLMKGVTKRVQKSSDLNTSKTFAFVSPTSTAQEKILSVRAQLLSNQQGIRVNGQLLPPPAKGPMDKLVRV